MTAPTLPNRAGESTSSTLLLLTRLTVAFSRRRAYPETHPLVKTAERQAYETLEDVFTQQSTITFSLGHEELLIDNAPVEQNGAIARDLADRLRHRGIGALAFDRQLTPEALSRSLQWLATEPDVSDEGVIVATKPPTLDGVTIARIAYGRLALGNDASNAHTEARDIWRLLASAAFFDDDEDMFDGSGVAIDPREALARRQSTNSSPGQGGSPRTASNSAGAPSAPPAVVDENERGAEERECEDVVRSGADEHAPERPSDEDIYGTTGRGGRGVAGGSGRRGDTNAPGTTHPDAEGIADDDTADVFEAEADPSAVASAIERRLPREGFAKRVAYVLLRVADQVSHAPEEQRALLGARLRAVLNALQSKTIGNIIRSIGVGSDQRRFMSQMIDAMPAGAIIEWLETASRATEQDLSHHMLRLLSKLSARTDEAAGRQRTEAEFRGAVKDLVSGWTLDDPNPNSHGLLLDQICRYDASGTRAGLQDPGTGRIVQISLEIDATCEDATDAATQMLYEGRVGELLQWAEEAPGRNAAERLQALIVSPAAIKAVLLKDPLDQAVARTLLASLDAHATETLLDVLRDADGRTTRRLVYDRLRDLGASLAPQFVKRLDGAAWYFVRNLLALLRDAASADSESAGSSNSMLFRFLDHQHEQVRVEALRLLVADMSARDAAIRFVLDDKSERVVSVALELLTAEGEDAERANLSPDLARRLLHFVQTGAHGEGSTVRAMRALAGAPASIPVRDMLLGMTSRRTWLMRKLALEDAGPTMLAALEVLATRYSADPRTQSVLALASRSPDARVRDTAARISRRARGSATS